MTDDPSRRAVFGGLCATLGGFGLGDPPGESSQAGPDDTVLRQGDCCLLVTPIAGDQPVEAFYGHYLSEQYASEENGRSSSGIGPPYSSLGTTYLQRPNGSILFLYDGPRGLSLVLVHGSVADPSGSGSVTPAFDGLPAGRSWPVKDDCYRNPETGEIAYINANNRNVGGTAQVID
jgi:hypothetical protein